jgi:hypothetical protein
MGTGGRSQPPNNIGTPAVQPPVQRVTTAATESESPAAAARQRHAGTKRANAPSTVIKTKRKYTAEDVPAMEKHIKQLEAEL